MLKSAISKVCIQKQHKERITSGDILKNVVYTTTTDETVYENMYQYLIVISQDCDLEQCRKNQASVNGCVNQFLPNILLLPAFPSEKVQEGNHCKELFGIKQERLNSDRFKLVKDNKNDRYHHIPVDQEWQIPTLIVDFKLYLTLSFEAVESLYQDVYYLTINELFREHLSQRFANYLSRIGLPELESNTAGNNSTK